MSSTIIYHQAALRLDRDDFGFAADHYLVAAQMGANNCYDSSGRRSRNWQVLHFGTDLQVLESIVAQAGDCEGGCVKLRCNTVVLTPEQFLSRGRRLLSEARLQGRVPSWTYRGEPLVVSVQDPATGCRVLLEERGEFAKVVTELRQAKTIDWLSPWNFLRVRGPELRQ